MMADAISHTVLLGIVLAFLITRELKGSGDADRRIPLAGLLTAFLVQGLHSLDVQLDASMGIVFTTLFAIGVILISTSVGNAHLKMSNTLLWGKLHLFHGKKQPYRFLGRIPKATAMLRFCFIYHFLFMIIAFI